MPERPPSIYEINDDNAPINAEHEVVAPATDKELEARAAETTYIDPEVADARAQSLGEARDAVMAQFEDKSETLEIPKTMEYDGKPLEVLRTELTGGRQWAVLADKNVGGGERWMILPETQPVALEAATVETSVEPEEAGNAEAISEPVVEQAPEKKPNIVVMDVITQDETNPAVMEAEAHLRDIQAAKAAQETVPAEPKSEPEQEQTQEVKDQRSLLERTHDRVESALKTVNNTERAISSKLQQTEDLLTRLNGYLKQFDNNILVGDQLKKVKIFTEQAESVVRSTRAAIEVGTKAVVGPLAWMEQMTADTQAGDEAHAIAEEGREALKGTGPSIKREDMGVISKNLNMLYQSKNRDEIMNIVSRTLGLVQERQAEQRVSASSAVALSKLQQRLKSYTVTHR